MAKKKGNNYIIDMENNIAKIEIARRKRNKNNKSGYRNVCWDGYKWVVQLSIKGKNTHLGRFDYEDLDKAGKFAEEMRQKYYGEFAGGN